MENIKRIGRETDLTVGPIFRKLLIYALPLVGVNLLQLLFNAADIVVLGIFAENSDNAVAAVGATTSIVNLMIGLFVGLSIGANVLVSKCMGQKDLEGSRRFVGTSILSSILFGSVILLIGFFGARTFMVWTKCDPKVIRQATTYLRIYFLGMPIVMLYNFSASILRAVGDTFRPFLYLIIGGIANVILNIVFITVFKLDVAGVAIATIVSQAISALLACIALIKSNGYCKLEKKHFKIYIKELGEIFKIGVPVGIAKCLFSFSNTFIQSSVNSFGADAMTAHSIGHQVDAFANEALHAIALASLSFVSQNLGAKNLYRVKKTIFCSYALIIGTGLIMGGVEVLLAPIISGIMTESNEIIKLSCERIYIVGGTSVLAGTMNLSQEILRGLDKSFLSMLITLFGSCLLRIIYLKTLFHLHETHEMVYAIYPITWLITTLMLIVAIIPTYRKIKRTIEKEKATK